MTSVCAWRKICTERGKILCWKAQGWWMGRAKFGGLLRSSHCAGAPPRGRMATCHRASVRPLPSFWAACTLSCSCLPTSRLSRGPISVHAPCSLEPSGSSEFPVSEGRWLLPWGGCPGCGFLLLNFLKFPRYISLHRWGGIYYTTFASPLLPGNLTAVSEGAWPTQEVGMYLVFQSLFCRKENYEARHFPPKEEWLIGLQVRKEEMVVWVDHTKQKLSAQSFLSRRSTPPKWNS